MIPPEVLARLKSELEVTKDWLNSAKSLEAGATIIEPGDKDIAIAMRVTAKSIRRHVSMIVARINLVNQERIEEREKVSEIMVGELFQKLGWKKSNE